MRRFRELGRHAEEVGVLLSLEMYEHTYSGSAASAVRLVEAIGMDVVGLNPDFGNLVRLHEPIEDWREVARQTLPYANYWHVKNYTRDEDAATGVIATSPTLSRERAHRLPDRRRAGRSTAGFQGVICTEHYGGRRSQHERGEPGVSARQDTSAPGLRACPEPGAAAVPARRGGGTMTRVFGDPETFVDDALEGFARAHQQIWCVGSTAGSCAPGRWPAGGSPSSSGAAPVTIRRSRDWSVRALPPEPCAATSSPRRRHVRPCASRAAVDAGGGILFSYGNYAGDVIHFGAAERELREAGIDVRTVLVTDDIASAPRRRADRPARHRRRPVRVPRRGRGSRGGRRPRRGGADRDPCQQPHAQPRGGVLRLHAAGRADTAVHRARRA